MALRDARFPAYSSLESIKQACIILSSSLEYVYLLYPAKSPLAGDTQVEWAPSKSNTFKMMTKRLEKQEFASPKALTRGRILHSVVPSSLQVDIVRLPSRHTAQHSRHETKQAERRGSGRLARTKRRGGIERRSRPDQIYREGLVLCPLVTGDFVSE